METKTNTVVHARVSPEVKRLLEERAARCGVNLASLIRKALGDHVGVVEVGQVRRPDGRSRSWFPQTREHVATASWRLRDQTSEGRGASLSSPKPGSGPN